MDKPYIYLITNGDVNQLGDYDLTKALLVDGSDDVDLAMAEFAARTGTPLEQVVVNPVGPRLN